MGAGYGILLTENTEKGKGTSIPHIIIIQKVVSNKRKLGIGHDIIVRLRASVMLLSCGWKTRTDRFEYLNVHSLS